MSDGWIQSGKVRAREADGAIEVVVDGLATQAKYYKPLIYEFFRKEWRGARPALGTLAARRLSPHGPPREGAGWGEFAVEIRMEYVGDPPWIDLDNLAKAILDAIKGHVFHDDAQVARLLVERTAGEREQIMVSVRRIGALDAPSSAPSGGGSRSEGGRAASGSEGELGPSATSP